MATELGILPTSIIAGETISESITGVTMTGALKYQFQASTPFEVDCTEGDTYFQLTVSATQTLTLPVGSVRFVGLNTVDGVTTCVDSGYITVYASPMATSDYSAALTAVESAIASYGSNPNKKLKIGEMEIEYRNLDDLISLRNYYKQLVNKDLGKSLGGGPFFIKTRFQ